MLTYAQVLANIYIIVNFQLRSSINAELTERSLYSRICTGMSPKMGFWGDFGGRDKDILWEPPRNSMTADLRRLVKKLWRFSKYPSPYERQRNYKIKS